jgi:hypothetical protein
MLISQARFTLTPLIWHCALMVTRPSLSTLLNTVVLWPTRNGVSR